MASVEIDGVLGVKIFGVTGVEIVGVTEQDADVVVTGIVGTTELPSTLETVTVMLLEIAA